MNNSNNEMKQLEIKFEIQDIENSIKFIQQNLMPSDGSIQQSNNNNKDNSN